MALPMIIYFIVFNYLPLYGLVLPFKDYKFSKGFFGSDWVGLDNFKFLLDNEQLNTAVINTVLYNFVFIFGGIFLSVTIALLLYEVSSRAVKVHQTLLYLPHYISWVVVAFAAKALLDMDYGLINKILVYFGAVPKQWYSVPEYWPGILIFSALWKSCGSDAVLYYAALMGTDKSLFEAAKMDGANKLQIIRYITIPSIKGIIIMMTILKIGKIFYGDFGLFYNLTLNSPLLYETTDVLDTYVYRALMTLGDVGLSSAVGFVQSVLGFILVIVTNLVVRRLDKDSALF
ncbi:MAG: sugar ABC transporter permease [Ruminococcaceae bacterium]|nr:sugar ABC transporter permease [Oscillospiraceae bacterium]